MSEYVLGEKLFLDITSGGSYYAVQSQSSEPSRDFLHHLLQESETPLFNTEIACKLSGFRKKKALEFVHWMQEAGFIYGREKRESAPEGSLEGMLPSLLKPLSSVGKTVLAESRGLYIGTTGYTHEATEELAALSSSLAAVYARHKDVLQGNLGYRQRAWGLVDENGNSEVGFWPIYIGTNRFTLIIGGIPQFNQPIFKRLIWMLQMRYGDTRL